MNRYSTRWKALERFDCWVRYDKGVLICAPAFKDGSRETRRDAICEINIPHIREDEPDFLPAVEALFSR